MNNWFDHIVYHARAQPETPALVMEDRIVTYGMLGAGIERCARHIANLKITGDRPVAVMLGSPIRDLIVSLALFRVGVPSISLVPSQFANTGMSFAAVLGDDTAKAVVAAGDRFVAVTDGWFATDPTAQDVSNGFSDDGKVCRLSLTSGSTGEPKVIALTVADIGRRTDVLLGSNWGRLLCMVGLSGAWGFWTACATLAAGATLCFSASPFQAARMIELFAIDYVMAATEQLLALTRVARTSGAPFRSLRIVEIGGNVPTRALLENALMHVCRNLFCRYGASETGPIARASAREVLARPGFAGSILPGIEVAIVDGDSHPCPPGTMGQIRCRRDPRWDGAAMSWTEVGDLGWINAEGELFVVGRAADLSALEVDAARRISPVHEAEHLLRLEWDASDAAAVVTTSDSGRVVISIGTVDCQDADAGKLEAILHSRGIDCTIRLVQVSAIPRGPNGKVQRIALNALLRASMDAAPA